MSNWSELEWPDGKRLGVVEILPAAPEPAAVEPTEPEQQLVWVAVVTTEDQDHGIPAIYVSLTEDGVLAVVKLQNGVPDEIPLAELGEWFQEQGMVLHHDSHYVE